MRTDTSGRETVPNIWWLVWPWRVVQYRCDYYPYSSHTQSEQSAVYIVLGQNIAHETHSTLLVSRWLARASRGILVEYSVCRGSNRPTTRYFALDLDRRACYRLGGQILIE